MNEFINKIEINKDSTIEAPKKSNEIDDILGNYSYQNTPSFDSTINNSDDNLGFEVKKKRGRKVKPAIVSGEIISGILFLSLIDEIIPMVISLANTMITKEKIDYKKLQLTADQKKDLEPVINEVVKMFEIKANPVAILIISLISIYGMNFAALKFSQS